MSLAGSRSSSSPLGEHLRGSILLVLAESLLRIRSVLILPLILKMAGLEVLGAWSQLSALMLVLAPAMSWGCNESLMKYLPGRSQKKMGSVLLSAERFYLYLALLTLIVLIVGGGSLSSWLLGDDRYHVEIVLAGVLAGFVTLNTIPRTYFRVVHASGAFAVLNLLQAASNLIFLGAAVIATASLRWMLVGAIFGEALVSIFYLGSIHRQVGHARPSWRLTRVLVRFGMVTLPAIYAMWTMNLADRLVLGHFVSTREIGRYSVAYSLGYLPISAVVNPLWLMFPTSAARLFNQGKTADLSRFTTQAVRVTAIACAGAVAIVGGSADLAFNLIGISDTRGLSAVAVTTLVAYSVMMLASHYGHLLTIGGWPARNVAFLVIAASSNLALIFLLVPHFGILGSAIATLVGFLVYGLCVALQAKRLLGIRPPMASVLVLATCGLAAGLVPTLVFRESTPAAVIIRSIFSILTFVLLLGLTGEITWHQCRQLIIKLRRAAPSSL